MLAGFVVGLAILGFAGAAVLALVAGYRPGEREFGVVLGGLLLGAMPHLFRHLVSAGVLVPENVTESRSFLSEIGQLYSLAVAVLAIVLLSAAG